MADRVSKVEARFPKMSLNRLLTVWLCITLPLQTVVMWPLHLSGPGLLVGPVLWIVLRVLNRRAWRRHFTPRAEHQVAQCPDGSWSKWQARRCGLPMGHRGPHEYVIQKGLARD